MLILSACQIPEGPGGLATIKGKIYVKEYNDEFNVLLGEYYGGEEEVYIVYGDDDVYSESMDTHYDGAFQFEYLRKGNYKIFVYSRDSLNPFSPMDTVVIREVEITSKRETVDLGDVLILK